MQQTARVLRGLTPTPTPTPTVPLPLPTPTRNQARVLRPGGRLMMLTPSRQSCFCRCSSSSPTCGPTSNSSGRQLRMWQRTHTPAELPSTRTASGTTLDEPASNTLSQLGGGGRAGVLRGGARASSLLRRILRSEAAGCVSCESRAAVDLLSCVSNVHLCVLQLFRLSFRLSLCETKEANP